ncbi:MAG: hypothetical protein QNJ78_00855 [Gammaproteobacteria bacterium]|nr:hypothetical protein [Gammaproteobacteria bacterium]
MTISSSGCSWNSLQRTGYVTLESVHLQQCLDNIAWDCAAKRTRHETYQAQRDRLQDEES